LGVSVELVFITTAGDVTERSLQVAGGQGLFTKEIQRALLEERIDLAVHSLKDLPTDPVAGLTLGAVPPRADPRDVLVSNKATTLDDLPPQAVVGTGSRRRQSQLLHGRMDLRVLDVRGNVETRLRKLDEEQYDALVLAKAGLTRLGLEHRITQVLSVAMMLPAVGQGALGLEIRETDAATYGVVQRLDDPDTHAAILAERALLGHLRAGCMAPVAAWARAERRVLHLSGAVLSADGRERVSVASTGDIADPKALGIGVANQLLALGAGQLIDQSREVSSESEGERFSPLPT
jgi:hydroxymethylbilane synthase